MTWLSGLSAPRHRQALFCKRPSAGCRKVKIQAACPAGAQPRGKANNANLHVTGKREGDLAREKVPCAGPEQGCCRCRVSFADEGGSSCWVPLGGSFTLSHSVSAVWPAEHRAPQSQLHMVSHQGGIVQSLGFNPASHSWPC